MNWEELILFLAIFLAQLIGLFMLFVVGYFLLVLTGLANSYGEHDQLMRWLKKIFRTGGKKK